MAVFFLVVCRGMQLIGNGTMLSCLQVTYDL